VALIDDNGTFDPPQPTCHDAAITPPGSGIIQFMEENWLVVMAVTLAIIMAVGVVLAVHHMRWKRLLREQLEMGHIDEEQYQRMK
jgi:hypothetical protein